MKIILKRKTNKPRKKQSSNHMTKKKGSKKSGSKSSSSGGGLFSGKVLGFKIPLVDKVIKNKTLQKVMVASGAVATITALVALVNNPTATKAWSNPLVRDAAALATGDIVGAIGNRVIQNPRIISSTLGGGQQMTNSQAGFA